MKHVLDLLYHQLGFLGRLELSGHTASHDDHVPVAEASLQSSSCTESFHTPPDRKADLLRHSAPQEMQHHRSASLCIGSNSSRLANCTEAPCSSSFQEDGHSLDQPEFLPMGASSIPHQCDSVVQLVLLPAAVGLLVDACTAMANLVGATTDHMELSLQRQCVSVTGTQAPG